MKIEDKKIILDSENDYAFIRLIKYILKLKYGSLEIKVEKSVPRQIIKSEKSILLTRKDKDSETYGG